LVVGTLDILLREDLWGRGHETLSIEIVSRHDAGFLVALAFAKLVATVFTVAAIRAGGVFTPGLFIGATLGGALASAWNQLSPGFGIAPEASALVGMAGLIAGSTHAPLTAIIIVFEMTGDYGLILPLMVCGAVAYLTARRMHLYSIYSQWLALKGEQIASGQDMAILERLKVRDCYNPNPDVIQETATASQIIEAIAQSPQTEFPVLDSNQRLMGMITYDDLRQVLSSRESLAPVILAGDLASQEFEVVTPEDSLRTAIQRISVRGSHYLPVVDSANRNRLQGRISRQDILTAYDRALLTKS
jgi:CIC family chloride channel protein